MVEVFKVVLELEDKQIKTVVVSKKYLKAVIAVDPVTKSVRMLMCNNRDFCYGFNSSSILVGGDCPPYCELIVAAKDYVFNRRKPKAKVEEIKGGIKDIEIKK
ncbi:hypothetical protein DRP05_14180 [Archaeoglobales archaeon]|nr:MAG: hypothetical protein DRP05_14180 [Archaeoglobales archaeon]